jgi:hypothetical protein
MARPLRIEFLGAFYHITSCGNAKGAIFLKYVDRIIRQSVDMTDIVTPTVSPSH